MTTDIATTTVATEIAHLSNNSFILVTRLPDYSQNNCLKIAKIREAGRPAAGRLSNTDWT